MADAALSDAMAAALAGRDIAAEGLNQKDVLELLQKQLGRNLAEGEMPVFRKLLTQALLQTKAGSPVKGRSPAAASSSSTSSSASPARSAGLAAASPPRASTPRVAATSSLPMAPSSPSPARKLPSAESPISVPDSSPRRGRGELLVSSPASREVEIELEDDTRTSPPKRKVNASSTVAREADEEEEKGSEMVDVESQTSVSSQAEADGAGATGSKTARGSNSASVDTRLGERGPGIPKSAVPLRFRNFVSGTEPILVELGFGKSGAALAENYSVATTGVVGRISGVDPDAKTVRFDIKGDMFDGTNLPMRGSVMVISVASGEATVDAVFNNVLRVEHVRNVVGSLQGTVTAGSERVGGVEYLSAIGQLRDADADESDARSDASDVASQSSAASSRAPKAKRKKVGGGASGDRAATLKPKAKAKTKAKAKPKTKPTAKAKGSKPRSKPLA